MKSDYSAVKRFSFSASEPGLSSERQLWSAVLGLAIEDYTDSRTNTQNRRVIRVWLASESHEPASFLWICDHLEIDAMAVRRRVIELTNGMSFGLSGAAPKEDQRRRD
jgi:hypothetical protein